MSEIAIGIAVLVVAALAVGRIRLARRPEIAFADAREERLSHRLAQAVGCPIEEAQAAVRREVQIAPDQTDDTILKRARYHYQREAPEKTCTVFRDRAPG